MPWFIAHEIQVLGPTDAEGSDPVKVWENLLVVEAPNLEGAFERAVEECRNREGPMLKELRGVLDLTPEQDRMLDGDTKFVGLSDLRLLDRTPGDGAIIESTPVPPSELVSSFQMLPGTEESLIRGVEAEWREQERWGVVEIILSRKADPRRGDPTQLLKEVVLVSAKTPAEALAKAAFYGRRSAEVWSKQSPAWEYSGPVWIGTAPDGIEHGAEILCRERSIPAASVKALVCSKEELLARVQDGSGFSS